MKFERIDIEKLKLTNYVLQGLGVGCLAVPLFIVPVFSVVGFLSIFSLIIIYSILKFQSGLPISFFIGKDDSLDIVQFGKKRLINISLSIEKKLGVIFLHSTDGKVRIKIIKNDWENEEELISELVRILPEYENKKTSNTIGALMKEIVKDELKDPTKFH